MKFYTIKLTDNEILNFILNNTELEESQIENIKINRTLDGKLVCKYLNKEDLSKAFHITFTNFELKDMYNRYNHLNTKYLKLMLDKYKYDDEYVSNLIKSLKNEQVNCRNLINKNIKRKNECEQKQRYLFGDTIENLEKMGEQMNKNNIDSMQTSLFDSGEQLTIVNPSEHQPE